MAAAAVILPFALYHPYEFTSKTLPDGSELSKVAHVESFYGTLKVVDSISPEKHSRYMMIDSMIQGGIDMKNGLSIYYYNYYLQYIPYMLHPTGDNCLVIGVGAGLVPTWYEQNGVTCDIVDIDMKVIQLAQEYFNFNNKGEVIAEDGRYFFSSSKKQYDYLILDAFNGDITPAHLLSREALALAKQRLKPEGILAINIIGSLTGENYMTASVVKTIEQVFDQVEIYPAFGSQDNSGIGNVIIIAYQGQPRDFQSVDNHRIVIHPNFEQSLRASMGKRFEFPAGTPAIVLTDNYNPIDFYDFWLRELVRKMILDTIDWDLLVG